VHDPHSGGREGDLLSGSDALDPAAAGSAPEDVSSSALSDHILHFEEEAAPEVSGDGTPEVAQVRILARTLSKAAKAIQLYPLENPMCRKFAADLFLQLSRTFQLMDHVRLSIGKNKLFFGGEVVLEEEWRDDSVSKRLFWSGVREITFHVGVTREECKHFLLLFRASAQQGEQGLDDLVTLLWEGKFEHLTYIAIDDILDLENENDPIPEEFGHDFMNFVDLDMHNIDEEDEAAERRAQEMAETIRAQINQDSVDLFGIPEKDWKALQAELEREESPEILGDVVQMLGETLRHETEELAFVELVQIMTGALIGLVGEGRLDEGAEIVTMLVDLETENGDLTPPMITALEAGLASAWDDTRCEVLVRHLDAGKKATLEGARAFVASLPETSLGALCNVLGGLQNPLARRWFLDALANKAQGNVLPFLPFLRDPRPELVMDVAEIVGRSGSERAVGPLRELLRHPDVRVRRKGLQGLSHVSGARAVDLLSEALFDKDPRIRMEAARSLGVVGRRAVPILLTVVEQPDFGSRPLAEKRVFFEALGYAGGQEVLPVVVGALKRRSFLRRGQTDELKACALEALGWIGGPEARRLLGEHVKDRSVLVRTAAQSGLRRIAGGNRDTLRKEAA